MKYLTPQIIAEITGGQYVGPDGASGSRVAGVARDNREVRPGNLFICIRGLRADGHDFANDAFQAGAACSLAEREIAGAAGPYVLVKSTLEAVKTLGKYHRSQFDIPVIGVTGSVGKTTAKEMISAALGAKYRVLKTQQNLNNELGVPLTLLSLDESHEAAVIEMGISEFGEMSRLADMVRPDIMVITKIGYAHIESFGDLNGVLSAKSEAFAFIDKNGAAILNGDDELLFGCAPGMQKITFGLDGRNDVRAENIISHDINSVTCDIVFRAGGSSSGYGRFSVTIPAYGSHLVMAALAAAAAGSRLGLTDSEVRSGLGSYAPVEGRANMIDTGSITLIDDSYNANPHSMEAALISQKVFKAHRVAVLGDMLELGEDAGALHQKVGRIAAAEGLDLLICCGDKAKLIADGYNSCGGAAAVFFQSKVSLLEALPGLLKKGDAVLVKASHGMKFSEVADALRALKL